MDPFQTDHSDETFIAAVQEGIEAADAGRTVPYEDVRSWALSWGTSEELLAPRCG